MSMKIIPTAAVLGAEIAGVDLSRPLDDAMFAAIEHAYNEYGVIFFRRQSITPAQQVAFTRRFGEIEFNIFGERWSVPAIPKSSCCPTSRKRQPTGIRRAGENWHSDMCYTARPPRGTILYAIETPSFTGCRWGTPSSPAPPRRGMRCPRASAASRAGEPCSISGAQAVLAADPRGNRPQSTGSPSARADPSEDRDQRLYVMRDDCTGIEGISTEEAEALICALADHIVKPQFIYRHQWRRGDLLMWDNCTVQHRAIQDYDIPQRRKMHRTTMGGAVPA